MKTNSRKRSPTVGEFIRHAYSGCFRHNVTHHGGTDPDHVPVIPGNDFSPVASEGNEPPQPSTATGNVDMTS